MCLRGHQSGAQTDVSSTDVVYAEEDHEGNVIQAVRSALWKLIVANEGNPRGLQVVELYDLVADPRERNDLFAEVGAADERVVTLKRHLDDLRKLPRLEPQSVGLTPESVERLRALGYIR